MCRFSVFRFYPIDRALPFGQIPELSQEHVGYIVVIVWDDSAWESHPGVVAVAVAVDIHLGPVGLGRKSGELPVGLGRRPVNSLWASDVGPVNSLWASDVDGRGGSSRCCF